MEYPFTLVIHGGAGIITKSEFTPELEKEHKDGLANALAAGYEILRIGGSALDAVEASVRSLEDCPFFNAGKGSVFNAEAKHELDASIMDGSTLKAGAVAAVSNLKNPVSAARLVMDKSVHVMLVGKGAEEFAKLHALETVEQSYYFTEYRHSLYMKAKEQAAKKTIGTVGAVALDKAGNIAAATSTGGMTMKKYGRIGDSPIIGAGTYANKECGVSCTGDGEYFIRGIVAYDIAAMMEYGKMKLQDAAKEAVIKKLTALGGEGGIIGVDKSGNVAMVFNSEGMYRGYVKSDGVFHVAIFGGNE